MINDMVPSMYCVLNTIWKSSESNISHSVTNSTPKPMAVIGELSFLENRSTSPMITAMMEMIKRAMVNKFRRETGADKKTAMDYLRKNNWDYDKAVRWFNFTKSMKAVGEAMRKLGEMLRKIGEANKEESHERDEDRIDQREMQGMSETGTGDTGSDGDEESQM